MKAILIIITVASIASCVSTTTTTILPDGTVTVVEQRGVDATSVAAAADFGKRITSTK
jgi:hypothetical protein